MLDTAARAFRAAGLHEKAAEAMLELGIVCELPTLASFSWVKWQVEMFFFWVWESLTKKWTGLRTVKLRLGWSQQEHNCYGLDDGKGDDILVKFTQTQVKWVNLTLIKTCGCRRHTDTLNGVRMELKVEGLRSSSCRRSGGCGHGGEHPTFGGCHIFCRVQGAVEQKPGMSSSSSNLEAGFSAENLIVCLNQCEMEEGSVLMLPEIKSKDWEKQQGYPVPGMFDVHHSFVPWMLLPISAESFLNLWFCWQKHDILCPKLVASKYFQWFLKVVLCVFFSKRGKPIQSGFQRVGLLRTAFLNPSTKQDDVGSLDATSYVNLFEWPQQWLFREGGRRHFMNFSTSVSIYEFF